jgi:UDP-N-acetylglucosamine 2-epimerase
VNKQKIFIVLGTRPEAIKMAPLALSARESGWADAVVCNTGQHREMTAQVLDLFGITPEVDLDIMRPGQSLSEVTTSILTRIGPVLAEHRPDWVVVQGDTTTTFSAALAAYYHRIPVAHVEAGLRTGDIYSPWPEEMNRRLVSEIACRHFPPTAAARDHLLREGIASDTITITGNTGIDALKILVRRLKRDVDLRALATEGLVAAGVPLDGRPLVLVTGHRRESFGEGFESICAAISTLAQRYPTHNFVYPVHPNPNVRETVYRRLGSDVLSNVQLVAPLGYLSFVQLMVKASLILTDSGGVQEEAPSLGKRVIVLRDVTERNEGLGSGLIRLAGTRTEAIVDAATDALDGRWPEAASGQDIYGDGQASARILATLRSGPGSTTS